MGYTITEMKERSAQMSNHFFDRSTMRFFKSKIESQANDEGLFVTSEQTPNGPRKFTLRKFDYTTGNVNTVGEFMGYGSRAGALEARRGY